MTEDMARQPGEIEELLAARQQVTDWLARLATAGSKVPEGVREKVRADYDQRLGAIVDQLREHSASIGDSLAGLRRELAEQERRQRQAEEGLAEAQLRHSVGEYSDDEWQAHEERLGTQLERHGAEIHRLGTEIVRLEEVLAQIAGSPARRPVAEEPERGEGELVELETETFITLDNMPADARTQSVFDDTSVFPTDPDPALEPRPAVPDAPKFTPSSGTAPPRPRPSAAHRGVDDELAFLKSVAPEPARGTATTEPAEAPATPVSTAGKTLKCQDCGTLNRPTEWYCERCGAELSAL